jgi:lipopolysaccharide transport system permease protein
MLGAAWAILSPFLMMAIYTTVFSVFLRTRLSDDPSPLAFAFYLLAGLLPWTAFAEAIGRATSIILEHQNLVKKVVFPLEVIPLSVACSALVNHLIALALFLGGVLMFRGWTFALLLLPLILIPYALLTAGISLLLASLGVYLRDLGQAIGFLLTVWLFLTPILYRIETVPSSVQPIIRANPFTALVTSYRRVILEGRAPEPRDLLWSYLIGVLACALGLWWFGRTKASFADVL